MGKLATTDRSALDRLTDMEDIRLELPPGQHGPAIAELVRGDERLHRLFMAMERDDDLRRLLLLHRHDLFALDEDNKVVRFHASCVRGQPGPIAHLAAIVQEEHQGNRMPLDHVLAHPLGGADGMKGFVELVGYSILVGIQNSRQLMALLNGERLTYARFRRLVREAGGLDAVLDKLRQEADSADQFDDDFVEHAVSEVDRVRKHMSRNLDQIAAGYRNALPDLLVSLHLAAQEWVDRITELTELSAEAQEHVLDQLVRLGLLETQSTLAWCDECCKDRSAHQILEGTFGPSKYRNLKCFSCERPMSYASLLYPLNALREVLLCKDGLLGAYMAWKLQTNSRLEDCFFMAGGRENDFLTTSGTLVEVKMFQTSRADGTSRQALGQAVNEFRKAADKVMEALDDITGFALITNLPAHQVARYEGHTFGDLPLYVLGRDGLLNI